MSLITGNQFGNVAAFPQMHVVKSGLIMRGEGPPGPNIGYVGSIYIDNNSRQIYMKRFPFGHKANPWCNHFMTLPDNSVFYNLKWFGASRPSNSLGVDGDHYLMWDCDAYSLVPRVFGPKTDGRWPENAIGPEVCATTDLATVLSIGLEAPDGSADTIDYAQALIHAGLIDETQYADITPFRCTTSIGLDTSGAELTGTLNPDWNVCE